MTRGSGRRAESPGGRRVRGLDADQRRERRRDDLLGAALTLFAERGYPDVSIEELCQTAYVGTKSFYELFDNKEQCYLALFERLAEGLMAGLTSALTSTGGEPDALIGAFARALVEDPRVPSVLFVRSTVVSAAVERGRRANRRWAASFIATVWQPRLSPRDDEAAARLRDIALGVVGGMFEIVADWLHDHDPASQDDVTRLIERLTAFHSAVYRGLSIPDPPATG